MPSRASASSSSLAARVSRTVRAMPPPARGDLEVAPAQEPLLELVRPPAAEGEMGVAVDQAGNHQPAAGIVALGVAELRRQCRAGADPADAVAFPHQRGVRDRVDLPLPAFGAAGGELADVLEEVH